jgi:hypothetical protein
LKAVTGPALDRQRSALRAKQIDLEIAREQRKPAEIEIEIEGSERRRLAGQDSSSARDHQVPAIH